MGGNLKQKRELLRFCKVILVFCIVFCVTSSYSQVVINEVMVYPPNDGINPQYQSLSVCSNPSFGREYIELYNPDPCNEYDLSCYIIGGNSGLMNRGNATFRFPPGTTIPPLGFLSIGGGETNATIILSDYCGTPYLSTGDDRWYLENQNGYLILWDPNGTPLDAVFWTFSTGQVDRWGTHEDISDPPTFIAQGSNCPPISSLTGPSGIPYGSPIVGYPNGSSSMGRVVHREPDGGSLWTRDGMPSINDCNMECSDEVCEEGDEMSLELSSEDNTVCDGNPCDYEGPSILINEVMLNPLHGDGSLYGCLPSPPPGYCNGEWIELYNPDACEWVDISCYFLGNNAMDRNAAGIVGDYPGGYIIPEGTVIPPLGFFILRGSAAPPVPSHLLVQNGGNVVEAVTNNSSLVCYGNGNRLWFPNHAGWFAFYDADGVPQDAISWNDIQNGISHPPPAPAAPPCMTCPPCNPGPVGGCTYSGPLAPYSNIPDDRKTYLGQVGTYVDSYEAINGLTFRRIPDGGAWATGSVAAATYATCNAACATPPPVECDGIASVTVSGGDPPYTYLWDDVLRQTTPIATELCEGVYCVTVTDSNNLTQTGCINVDNITLDVSASTSTPTVCVGETIQLNSSVSNGTSPFEYVWTGPGGFNETVQNPSRPNAQLNHAGTYSVTVTDFHTCTGTDSVDVDVVESAVATIEPAGPFCVDDPSYQLVAENSGVWTGPGVSSTGLFTPSNAGEGTHIITNTVGSGACSDSDQITIVVIGIADATITPAGPFCLNDRPYQLEAATGGGVWSGTGVDPSTGFFTPSVAGTHTITYTIEGECGDSDFITITVHDFTVVHNTIPTSCPGYFDGVVEFSIIGGNYPFSYQWEEGGPVNDSIISGLGAGNYTFTITDSLGCISIENVIIQEPDPVIVNTFTGTPTCYGYSDGYVYAIAFGGSPFDDNDYDYEYNGSTIGIGSDSISIEAGSHSVTVTDARGCFVVNNFTVKEPPPIYVSKPNGGTICIGEVFTTSAHATGGTLQQGSYYSFVWTAPPDFEYLGEKLQVSPDSTTTYTLIVTDDNGCESEPIEIIVDLFPPLSIVANSFPDQVCFGEKIEVNMKLGGGNGGPYTIYFDDRIIVNNPHSFSPPETGYYKYEVRDECGSPTDEDSIYVIVHPLPEVSFYANPTKSCPPGFIRFFETTENENQTYSWSFGDGGYSVKQNPGYTYEQTGLYTVSLSIWSEFGCKNTLTRPHYITIYPTPRADFIAHPKVASIINPFMQFENRTEGGFYYFWDFGDGSDKILTKNINDRPSHFYNNLGDYFVTLISENIYSCFDTVVKKVHIRDEYTFYAPNAFTPNGDGVNDFFYVTGHGINPESFYFSVYDRWGMRVFETDVFDVENPRRMAWDGTKNGNVDKGDDILPNGVYVWYCSFIDFDGKPRQESGTVLLIR